MRALLRVEQWLLNALLHSLFDFFSGLTLADKNVHQIRIQPFQLGYVDPYLLGQIGTISSDFTMDYKNAYMRASEDISVQIVVE